MKASKYPCENNSDISKNNQHIYKHYEPVFFYVLLYWTCNYWFVFIACDMTFCQFASGILLLSAIASVNCH